MEKLFHAVHVLTQSIYNTTSVQAERFSAKSRNGKRRMESFYCIINVPGNNKF